MCENTLFETPISFDGWTALQTACGHNSLDRGCETLGNWNRTGYITKEVEYRKSLLSNYFIHSHADTADGIRSFAFV